jgi:SulP family sulfate permease
VQHIDISGIRMLENVRRVLNERGGEIYFVRVREPVLARMRATGFYEQIRPEQILDEDKAIGTLFYHVIDPAVCIYECERRAFLECHSLPKRTLDDGLAPTIPLLPLGVVPAPTVAPRALWEELHGLAPPLVVDVREPREFRQSHIPGATLLPLEQLLRGAVTLPRERAIVLACRSGRRSARAAAILSGQGYERLRILDGGMLSWESANLLSAVEV